MKLSEPQEQILLEMLQTGYTLKMASGIRDAPPVWVEDLVLGREYRSPTVFALKDRGLIIKTERDGLPWYRVDYILTAKGRQIAEQIRSRYFEEIAEKVAREKSHLEVTNEICSILIEGCRIAEQDEVRRDE